MTFVRDINLPPPRKGLRELLGEPGRFVFAVEIETTRGLAMEEPASRTARLANELVGFDGVDVLCLTDNPGGNPNIRPEALGLQMHERGQEVVVNVSCKDYNRNGIESRLWALGSYGFDSLLALTGDYPTAGYAGAAQAVFDIDSVGFAEDCIWARAYDRLKSVGQEETMLQRPVVFKDGGLQGTSAWANTFLGRDHYSETSEGQASR